MLPRPVLVGEAAGEIARVESFPFSVDGGDQPVRDAPVANAALELPADVARVPPCD